MNEVEELLEPTRVAANNAAALHYLFKASERAVKDKIVVLSPGSFSGNSKYIYSYLHYVMAKHNQEHRLFWLSHNKNEAARLREAGVNAHWSRQDGPSMRLLIETKVAFVSTHHFARPDYCVMQAALASAIKVQLWHGIPAKRIAYERAGIDGSAVGFSYFAYDCLSADYIVTESKYVTPRYQAGFPKSKPIIAGSARTDILLADPNKFPFWDVDTKKDLVDRMSDWRKNGGKVLFYAPTYREASQDRSTFLREVGDFMTDISRDSEILLVFKNHSSSKDQEAIESIIDSIGCDRIFVVPSNQDSYPYLRESDVLITDYSSIYYDFLLTNRQVVFFQPDYESYTETRDIYDEQSILGRPLGHTVSTGKACAEIIRGKEPLHFYHNRAEVKDKLYASKDGKSSERLIAGLERTLGKIFIRKSKPSLSSRIISRGLRICNRLR